jgi:hypothetical protein
MASTGDKFAYGHADGMGFGEAAKADAGLGEITAEMTELDLKDGQEVEFMEYDADSGWPIIRWVDAVGIERITTIDPALFDSNFQPV